MISIAKPARRSMRNFQSCRIVESVDDVNSKVAAPPERV
ncbi:hypothetical protein NIES2104_65230 [Leptolyngbya sp. NIES-2104]|nr:hypothetical protein NIES2104_65230 [Leptolyngbya sp. NIES-2104]